jgi:branched-chain amino acid transport system ATP-binding protein
LRIEAATVRFGGVTALDDVTVFVPESELCAVIGPNGAGKSTLFNVASGLVAPQSGRVYVNGLDVTDLPAHRRATLGIGRTFQSVEVFRDLSVVENVMLAARRRLHSGPFAEALRLPSARRDERMLRVLALDVLAQTGLERHALRRPAELPLGVLRMLELAMAIAGEPRVLLLDEPSAGLDEAETEMLGEMIAGVRASTGAAVLLVEHDMSIVGRLAEHVYVLDFGRVIASGAPDVVRRDPLVVEKYLGAEARPQRARARRSSKKEVARAGR